MRSSFQRFLDDSDGAKLDAVTKTATFNSEILNIGAYDQVGLVVETTSSGGTSPTLDIKLQFSVDGGSNWLDVYPQAENSETQASLTQITGDAVAMKFFPVWAANMSDSRARFVFTIGGTSPTFDVSAYLICRKLAEGAV